MFLPSGGRHCTPDRPVVVERLERPRGCTYDEHVRREDGGRQGIADLSRVQRKVDDAGEQVGKKEDG